MRARVYVKETMYMHAHMCFSCVSVCLYVGISLSLVIPVSMCTCLYVCMCMTLCVCMSVSECVRVYVCVYLCECVCVCICVLEKPINGVQEIAAPAAGKVSSRAASSLSNRWGYLHTWCLICSTQSSLGISEHMAVTFLFSSPNYVLGTEPHGQFHTAKEAQV